MRIKMIIKRDNKWFLYSKDGSKKLGGPYTDKSQAIHRERQVHYFKKTAATLGENWDLLKYTLKHKYSILSPGKQLGVPFWTLLKHDLDKFKPSTWKPYVEYYKGKQGITGTNDPKVLAAFEKAVALHKKINPHHLPTNEDPSKTDILEAIADWYSAGKTQAWEKGSPFPTFKGWMKTTKFPEIVNKVLD